MRKYTIHTLILTILIGVLTPTYFSLADIVCPNGQIASSDGNSCIVGGNANAAANVTAGGETKSEYTLLAPLPCTGDAESGCVDGKLTTFDPATDADNKNIALSAYLNLMIRLFIGICAVLAVIMIVMGGVEYMTSELISGKEAGKERITNAIFGLLLALGSWTILNQINPKLLNTDLESLKTVAIEVDLNDNIPQTYDEKTRKYKNGAVYGSKWDDAIGTKTPLPPYVTLNNGGKECTFVGEGGCTSTRNLDISAVKAIQWGCKCSLVITGGTEFWKHGGATGSTTHQLGSSTVDLRPSAELDKYLSGGLPLERMKRYPPPNGPNLYEGNHWHIGR